MGSNAQRRRDEREKKVAQMRNDDAKRSRRSTTIVTVLLVIAVVAAVGGVVWAVQAGTEDPTPGALDEVQVYDYTSVQHTTDPVEYKESPPVGGPHDPVPQTCGFYDAAVPNEKAVHSLEHGAVWITYLPDLSDADVATLKGRLTENYTLLSPYADQSAPVVATAWNNQLELDGVDDPRLDDFVTEFRQGPQTPEPGSPC